MTESEKKPKKASEKRTTPPKATVKTAPEPVAKTAPKTAPKPAAKKKTMAKVTNISASSGIHAVPSTPYVGHDQIAALAHRLWIERGRRLGHDLEDWREAEHLLRAKAS